MSSQAPCSECDAVWDCIREYDVHMYNHNIIFSLPPPSLPPSFSPSFPLPVQAEVFAQAAARFRNQAAAFTNMGGGGKPSPSRPSEEEVSETNQRNKAISSSAITRAMADAQTGKTPFPHSHSTAARPVFDVHVQSCTCTCIIIRISINLEPQLPRL